MKIFDVTKMTPLQYFSLFLVLLLFFTVVAGSVLHRRAETKPLSKSTRVIKVEELSGNRYYFMANGDTLVNCTATLLTSDGQQVGLSEGDSVSYPFGTTNCIVYPSPSLYRFIFCTEEVGECYYIFISPANNPLEQSSINFQNRLNFNFNGVKKEDYSFFRDGRFEWTSYAEFPRELFMIGDTFVIVETNDKQSYDFYNLSLRRIMKNQAGTDNEFKEAVVLARSNDIIRLDNQTCLHRPGEVCYDFDKAAPGDTIVYVVNQYFKKQEKQLKYISVK